MYTVDISNQANDLLEQMANREDRQKTSILRKMLGLYGWCSDRLHGQDNRYLAIIDKDGKIIEQLKWR